MTVRLEQVSDEGMPVALMGGAAAAPIADAPISEASPSERSARPAQIFADFVTLAKPGITRLVVATMLGGIWIASRTAPHPERSKLTLALAVLGTVFVVAGANALNMYIERDTDRLMARTANRPLPAGRMAPEVALAFGMLLGLGAIPLLTFAVNAVTGLLAAIALTTYVLVYTPMKRRSTFSLFVGAVPGAIPALLGWTAVTGSVGTPGLLLFAILFFWQLPHSIAIATFRRDDYRRAGLKTLPIEQGAWAARVHMVVNAIALVLVSLLIVPAGVGGVPYVVAASVLGAVFLAFVFAGLRRDVSVRWAKSLFFYTLIYLPVLFVALMASA